MSLSGSRIDIEYKRSPKLLLSGSGDAIVSPGRRLRPSYSSHTSSFIQSSSSSDTTPSRTSNGTSSFVARSPHAPMTTTSTDQLQAILDKATAAIHENLYATSTGIRPLSIRAQPSSTSSSLPEFHVSPVRVSSVGVERKTRSPAEARRTKQPVHAQFSPFRKSGTPDPSIRLTRNRQASSPTRSVNGSLLISSRDEHEAAALLGSTVDSGDECSLDAVLFEHESED
ncbi:hypothetical protein J8273_2709 [Carpediemonas membranifera]|uniref:Uncharacterized protein n=1 Tax=Carpediemonas membranifera TaxID=201153 RepID=A0A8J6E5I2_9EUKA|nr:hypothetical protein J8273_2709 [Carpediemonas membranifera]|eukprot:KAG9395797.1 hypothetical protein J8273_2709 [Carpediemonas membranifera]